MNQPCYKGPITGNAKCVIISLLLAGGYWYAPPKNKWILAGLLYFTYLAIAWYDHYLCHRVLTPSFLRHFYDWAKPRESIQTIQYQNLCPETARSILIGDIIVFIILVALFPRFLKWKPK